MTSGRIGAGPPRALARHDVPEALRDDVRLLGGLLGTVLRESGGADLLADVERLRDLTIRAHDQQRPDALEQAEAFVESLAPQRAEQVARAFTCYFHLANLAEECHRVRALHARRAGLDPHGSAPDDPLPAAVTELAQEIGFDGAIERLQALEFRPVVTAHPTEARRRAVASVLRRISDLVVERDARRIGGTTLAENERRLLAEIETLWRTAPLRTATPTVLDEVRTVMAVFDATLFEVFPAVYRRLDDWLQGDDAGAKAPIVRPFIRLGSWVGGDRDGNPYVTADVTRAAAVIASEHVLAAYESATRRTGRALTHDAACTPASPGLRALWARQCALSPTLTARVARSSPDEPHRRALLVVAERIAATRRGDDLAYARADQLAADLAVVQSSLIDAGAPRAAFGDLQQVIWQVQTFGFHLAELEVRQHSQVHEAALADIAEHGVDGPLEDMTTEVLDTFRAIAAVQRRYGVAAAQRYVVAGTRRPEHLAAVYELAELVFPDPDQAPVIDAVPLFESLAALEASVEVLDAICDTPAVQRRLADNGRRLEVMLGYADSSKGVGPVAATLALDVAQREITQWAHRRGITLTLFHGRGGVLGRGGGSARRALLAQPPGSVDGRFTVTEQGEVIFARYGDPAIAARHIEQVTAAMLLAGSPSRQTRNARATARFAPLAAVLDEASRARFSELVHADGFPHWFAQVTPLEEIGLLALGSRPARRGQSVDSLDDLRAIPWVFAWSQARTNLAGWFGLGAALDRVGDLARLRAAYADWELFATLIDDVEMSLATTDDRIAARYLALGGRADLADLVLAEMALTRRWVLAITGHDVAAGRGALGSTIDLRSGYLDALSLLQLRALRRLRAGVGADQDGDLRLLLLSVNGVAAGLRNTG